VLKLRFKLRSVLLAAILLKLGGSGLIRLGCLYIIVLNIGGWSLLGPCT